MLNHLHNKKVQSRFLSGKKSLLLPHLIFHIFICVVFSNTVFSQVILIKQWDYRYGGSQADEIHVIHQTTDGGYILGGSSMSGITGDKTQPSQGSSDFWIVKTDSLGLKQWDYRFGGNNSDVLNCMQQTADGGYILGGQSFSDSSGDKTQNLWGMADYWIVKIDSLGTKQWDKDFGGTGQEVMRIILQTTDGGYLLGGDSDSDSSGTKSQYSRGGFDFWIVKTDSLGNEQWDYRFGGTNGDALTSAQQTADGGYILAGPSASGMNGDKTQPNWDTLNFTYDYWIVKVDSSGIKQWDYRFGGFHSDDFSVIKQTSDGGYILGGKSNSTVSGDKTDPNWDPTGSTLDYWIVKTDSLGIKQWDKDFGGIYSEDYFSSISQTADGGYLMGGTSESGISGDKTQANLGDRQTWVVKTDSLGNKQWDKTLLTLGTDFDMVGFAIQTQEGCYLMANYTNGVIAGDKTQPSWNNSYDYWIIKFCDSIVTTSSPTPTLPGGEGVAIAPNPASDWFQVSGSGFQVERIEIFNVLGKVVLCTTPSPPGRVGVGLLASGIYILKAYTEKDVFQQKLVINH